MPMTRAGSRRKSGNQSASRIMNGGVGSAPETTGETIRFCTNTCNRWVRIVGGSRRRCTASRSSAETDAGAQFRDQDVGGGDGVLDREVHADAADRRHRMRRVPDA